MEFHWLIISLIFILIEKAASEDGILTLPLSRHNNHYTVDMGIGVNKNDVLKLLLDTGSSDMVLMPYGKYQTKYTPFLLAEKKIRQGVQISGVSSSGEPLWKHHLVVDERKKYFDKCIVVTDSIHFGDVSIRGSMLFPQYLHESPPPEFQVQVQNWTGFDGVIGIAYPTYALINSTLSALFANNLTQKLFALELNWNESKEMSYLHIGGVPSKFKGKEILWSERQPLNKERLSHHGFPIYHLEMCGVDLFSNYSSHWFSIVDSGAVCLGLPDTFFDMVMAWIPSECLTEQVQDIDNTLATYVTCHVSDGALRHMLPDISFRLSEEGPKLSFSLADLLLKDNSFCLSRQATNSQNLYGKKIAFGSMIMSALRTKLVLFDMEKGSVGFIFAENSNEKNALPTVCATKPKCKGDQKYYAPLNICEDPNCDAYYFRTLDYSKRTCQIAISSQMFLLFMISGLVCMDIFIRQGRIGASIRLKRHMEGSPSP